MTHTPEVALYGADKSSPHFFDKESNPSANGVHKWVSSYADYYGYGWWNPEQYTGVAVKGHDDGINRHGYGIGKRRGFDSKKHNGALHHHGVAVGYGGRGYTTAGKWQVGDQETSLRSHKGESVMRRRTITQGGQLTGAAHEGEKSKIIGARPTYAER